MQKYAQLNQSFLPMPSRVLVNFGVSSVILHMMILLVVFFYTNNYISCAMFNYEWYNASITMCLLIEHAVWLHLLWTLATAPYYSLVISYLAVLFSVISWTVVVVIPMEPDPLRLHAVFAIFFSVGCIVNLYASFLLLPGKAQGIDPSYKIIFCAVGSTGVLASLSWFTIWLLKKTTEIRTDWHIEPDLQIVAQTTYLAGLAVVLYRYK